jgi:DNA processing protein
MLGVGRAGPTGRQQRLQPRARSDTVDTPAERPAGRPSRAGRRRPPTISERDAWVVLNGAEGVGPVSFARLVSAFGDVRAVLDVALRHDGAQRLVTASAALDGLGPTVSPKVAHAIVDAARSPERLLEPTRRARVEVLILPDVAYPARLRRVDLPPPVLFVWGSAEALDRGAAVAIVGTRRPTGLGRATAGRIADALAGLGATVVSGLALGIDSAAHVATVRAGHPTVAVIGGGHLHLYPAANRNLVRSIVATGGAVVSEFAPDTIPTRGTFPRRNRIISGLADATIVVEAGARSGALTTAAWALEQGRGLHIVPGRLDDPAVAGSLAFLREAGPEAQVVAGIPELIDDLGLLLRRPRSDDPKVSRRRPEPKTGGRLARPPTSDAVLAELPAVERLVAERIVSGQGAVDELVASTGLSGAGILGTLTSLEMRGLVVEVFGRYRPAGALARARQP